MLSIENLHVVADHKHIIKGLSLHIPPGELHVIMGPNGAGKSTLSHVLAGKDGYDVTDGTILFDGDDLLALSPEIRSRKGLFLAFQYPVEIPGVTTEMFLRVALNEQRKYRGESSLDPMEFQDELTRALEVIPMRQDFLKRSLNEGFSGGEKKRNEMLQLALLQPKLAILDETDSGLDVDALRTIAQGVNTLRNKERSFLVITHYERLLSYLVPDVVHIMVDGKIIATGGPELAKEVEESGYASYISPRHE